MTGAEQTYCAKHELPDHAEDQVGPEYMKTEENHQHQVEEVVAKVGWVVENRINPGTVDEPETRTELR